MVKILVACGSGVATSMQAAVRLKDHFAAEKLKVKIDACSVNELQDKLGGCDIIVSSAKIPFDTKQAVFNAIPLLTGIGAEQLLSDIANKVRELS
ncbi:MAG: PTS sugar transporter subunit IIB [Treponema sp.]|nr:PTS sugar transporter subunit IIB [Treponema sp.]